MQIIKEAMTNKQEMLSATLRGRRNIYLFKYVFCCNDNKGNLQARRCLLSGQACWWSTNRSGAPYMACGRLIERLAALNCAAPSAQVPEPARHVTDSNRPSDEQMRAGVRALVYLRVCVVSILSLCFITSFLSPFFFFF